MSNMEYPMLKNFDMSGELKFSAKAVKSSSIVKATTLLYSIA